MTIDSLKEFIATRPTWQKTVAIIAVLLIAGVALIGGRHSSGNRKQAAAPAAMTVTTVPLATQQLSRSVAATGAVYPWQEVVISSEVGGYRVAEIRVDVGDRVRKGQELVRLSDEML